jgi:hypothetical protein
MKGSDFLMALCGCTSEEEVDLTAEYIRDATSQGGYRVGSEYQLQADLFVIKLERPHGRFTKPGDMAPTVAEWESGRWKKDREIKVISLVRAGSKVRVEKVIFIKSKHGTSQVAPMLRAEGVELLINPFGVSDLRSTYHDVTLCAPDSRYLREVR